MRYIYREKENDEKPEGVTYIEALHLKVAQQKVKKKIVARKKEGKKNKTEKETKELFKNDFLATLGRLHGQKWLPTQFYDIKALSVFVFGYWQLKDTFRSGGLEAEATKLQISMSFSKQ